MDWNNYKLELVEGHDRLKPSAKVYELRFYVNGILRYFNDHIPASWVKERENALVFVGSEFSSVVWRDVDKGNGAEYRNRISKSIIGAKCFLGSSKYFGRLAEHRQFVIKG